MIILPIAVLLTGVLLQLVLGRVLSKSAKGWTAFGSGILALASTLWLLSRVNATGAIDASFPGWEHDIALSYHVDGLSIAFMLLATGIGSAILLYCVRYMEHEVEGLTRFYALMLTFIAGLVNLVCSANLLMAYVSWEVIGLCSYFLVGFWYRDRAATQGARKVLVMTHLAGYGFLAGILLLAARSGTFNWTDPALGAAASTGVFLLLLVAAMAKSVIFPLHTWIPEAMNAPTPVSALLHSACYVKAGVYLIARLYSIFPEWQPWWHTLILALGCATMIVGALFALVQTDLKRLLAYSTISQLGYIITGLAIGTPLGAAAGLFYCLSHGLFKGTLFLCAGVVQHAAGTRDMRLLGGLAHSMPHTARIWVIAAAAIVGVPLTNGFVAKWLLYDAALEAGLLPVVVTAWIVSTFTAFYMLKATATIFFGEAPDALQSHPIHDASLSMRLGMGTLAAAIIAFGLAPQLLVKWVVVPGIQSMGFESTVQSSWLGLHTVTSDAPVTVGAIVALLAILVGVLTYRAIVREPGTPVHVFTGGDPLSQGNSVGSVDFAEMAETAFAPAHVATNPDPLYMAIWKGMDGAASAVGRWVATAERSLPEAIPAAIAIVILLCLL